MAHAVLMLAVPLLCAAQARKPQAKPAPQLFGRDYWLDKGAHIAERLLDTTLAVAGILLVYFVVRSILYRMIDGISSGLMLREERLGIPPDRVGRLKTLSSLFKSTVGYVTFFVFGVLIFKAIGFDIMPFVTTAGVIGLAIGFGAQKLVKDVISGIFIIVDNMFVVGDTVTIGAVTGKVEEMGMRVTRLQDLSGRIVTISNGDIGQVINLSRKPVEEFIDIAVAAATEVPKLTEAVALAGEKVMNEAGHALKAAPQVVGITALSAASFTVRISVVAEPVSVQREQMRVREALRDAFTQAGIALA